MIEIEINDIDRVCEDHYNRISDSLKIRFDNSIKSRGFNHSQKVFLKKLRKDCFEGDWGDSLLCLPPKKLAKRITEYKKRFKYNFKSNKDFRLKIQKIFNYDNRDSWGAYKLAKSINVNVCPYCNRSYIFTIGDDKLKGTRPEFDHFFSQEVYPYLSLSFYNLIPSCKICNSGLKGTKEFSLKDNLHPYIEELKDKPIFSLSVKKIDFINGMSKGYEILIPPKKSKLSATTLKKLRKNAKIFKLVELYEAHKDYIDEIIIKSQIYSPAYLESMYNSFKGIYFGSMDDLRRIILGNYTNKKDLGKRPLAKLTKDIAKELKLI